MWEEGDNPSTEHRRHFPRCPFVCNLPVGNIPIGNESEAAQIREQEVATGIDVCGPFATARFASGQEPGKRMRRTRYNQLWLCLILYNITKFCLFFIPIIYSFSSRSSTS